MSVVHAIEQEESSEEIMDLNWTPPSVLESPAEHKPNFFVISNQI